MPALELQMSNDELDILEEYLQRMLSDLSVKIAGTDRQGYREEIKAERRLLEHVVEQLAYLRAVSRYETTQVHRPAE